MGIYANASPSESENSFGRNYDGSSYIFVEGDVEFSVFPDGQFDFVYVGPQNASQVTIISPNGNVSYNAGYNYDTYVQYDSYGAVIQIENVPVYYDEYGRISQAGNVEIRYNDRRIVRVGGLRIIYNNYGYFSHCSGAINVFNPYYVYRPWHMYYARPLYTHVIVYDYPYRRHYHPVRYSYHDHLIYYKNRGSIAYNNGRRDFNRPGSQIHYENGRVERNNDFDPNRVNTMAANTGRNNTPIRTSVPNETSPIRTNSPVRTQPGVRTSAPIKTSVPSRDNNTLGSQTTRVNPAIQPLNTNRGLAENTPIRSSVPNGSSINNSNVRSNNIKTDRTQLSSQNTSTYSAPANNGNGSSSQIKNQTPRTTTQNNNTVRNVSSSTKNNVTVSSSRGTSSNRSNSSRTRG